MTTLEILIEARRLLAQGWCQHRCQWIDKGDVVERDIVTALNDATGGRGMGELGTARQRRAYQLVYEAAGGAGIIAFNDDPRTTIELVLFTMDNCIAEQEADDKQAARLDRSLAAEHRPVEA
jgi:hypothetical protein